MRVGGAGAAPTQADSSTQAGICDRTVQVREAILARVGATDCDTVTAADLAALTDTLRLKEAGISMLRPGDFSGLTGLRGLVLTRNSLTELPADIFAGLVSLRSLKLTLNNLGTLPDGVFEGLVVLDTLDVEFNRLETLPAGIFDGLNLRFLGLEGNRLRTLQLGVFDGLGGSLMLDLSHNGMESVASGVFTGLGELTFLDLSVNRLQTLPAGVFAGLNSMNSMWLDQNPGASFTFRMIVERVPGTDKIVVRVPEGAPFDMTTAIGATGGSLPAGVSQVTVGVGRTTSEEIEVVGLTGTTITLGAAPPVPTDRAAEPAQQHGVVLRRCECSGWSGGIWSERQEQCAVGDWQAAGPRTAYRRRRDGDRCCRLVLGSGRGRAGLRWEFIGACGGVRFDIRQYPDRDTGSGGYGDDHRDGNGQRRVEPVCNAAF